MSRRPLQEQRDGDMTNRQEMDTSTMTLSPRRGNSLKSKACLTDRDRFLRVMRGQSVDRAFSMEVGLWEHTIERWRREGLPTGVDVQNIMRGNEYFGLDRVEFLDIDVRPVPKFQEETLEETDRHVVYRDDLGIVRKALKDGTVRGKRTSMDQYLTFPVTCREDFLALRQRYDPESPSRYPPRWDDMVQSLKDRDYPLFLVDDGEFGFYWKLREFMGTERLSYAFYDEPELIEEILDFLVEFFMRVTKQALADLEIDCMSFSEDMAGKGGPLVSPAMFRRFFLPCYHRVCDYLRSHGVNHIWVDSDGYTVPLIPLWLEAGVNGHWPLEVTAGMEPLELREQFGDELVLVGGIDKRELAKDRAAIERELRRIIPPMLERGRFIPTVDHNVPPNVPFENFMYYLEVKKELCEGHFC